METIRVRCKKGLTYRNIKHPKDTVIDVAVKTAERRPDLFEARVSGIIVPSSVLDEVTASEDTPKPTKRKRSRGRSQE